MINRTDSKGFLNTEFLTVCFLHLLLTICLQMNFTAMPIYIESIGITRSLVGSYTTACTLTALLFRPFSAYLVDKYSGKLMAYFATLLYVIVFVACFSANTITIILLLGIIQGIGLSIISTALGAVAITIIPKDKMTKGISYYGIGNSIAISIGPAIGLSLINNCNIQGLSIFGVSASLLCLCLLIIIKADNRIQRSIDKTKKKSSYKIVPKECIRCGAIVPSLILVIISLCHSALTTFLSFFGISIGISDIGFFFILNTFGIIASRIFLVIFNEKFKDSKIALVSGILLFISFISLSIAKNFIPIVVSGIIYGFGYGGFYTILNTGAVKKATATNRGIANAMFYGAKDAAFSIGTLVWGIIYVSFGYNVIFITAGILSITAILCFKIYNKK